MNRTFISALECNIENTVKVCGWVQTIRGQKRMQFLVIRDRTGLVQAVHERQKNETLAHTIESLTAESAVVVIGKVVHNPSVKLNPFELVLQEVQVVGKAESPLPIDANSSPELRLDWRQLDLRRPENLLVFQVQTTALEAMRGFWRNEGFIEIQSPKLLSGASEGGSEVFKLDYFGRPACLAQSPQLYKQMVMGSGFDRVFEIGPAFRAEMSLTTRHAAEFTSIDTEMAWIDSHEDVMSMQERCLAHMLRIVQERHGAAIEETFGTEVVIPEVPFPRVTIKQAYEYSAAMGYPVPREAKGDLDPEGERRVAQYVKREFGHEFVFVTDYPISVRPFYHLRPEHNQAITNSFDLLWKGVEVTTGSQREHRYERLLAQAEEKGVNPDTIRDYLNFFRFGMPPHGGYGLGLARLLMQLMSLKSIRDGSLLFRGPNRLTP